MPHCTFLCSPRSVPWLRLGLNELLLLFPKLLLVLKKSESRLHLNLETLELFNPPCLLGFRPQPMYSINCAKFICSASIRARMKLNVPTVIHPCSDIGISLDVHRPKPRQRFVPLPTNIRCNYRRIYSQILALQDFVPIKERGLGTKI